MAVYTEVDQETLKRFLEHYYSLGTLVSAAGIPEGIENTNYALETGKGHFILTLFEKRSPEKDLPFFMSLMDHLAGAGFPCPLPIRGQDGGPLQNLKGKKATIVTFIPGKPVMAPRPDHCRACGNIMARMHLASADFTEPRPNPLGLEGCTEIFKHIRKRATQEWPGLEQEIENEISFLNGVQKTGLPIGIIHADLFPDNVHFSGQTVSGVIDLYFACTEALAYDIAIAINSWCFDESGSFKKDNFAALLKGYETVRPLTPVERKALPSLMRRAALRFLLTRAQDWLFPQDGVLGAKKDPLEYMKILSFHRGKRHIGDYLEEGKQP